jgi:hypothetical protein
MEELSKIDSNYPRFSANNFYIFKENIQEQKRKFGEISKLNLLTN